MIASRNPYHDARKKRIDFDVGSATMCKPDHETPDAR